MIRLYRRLAGPLVLAMALLLSACGGRQAAAPTSAPAPVEEAPTRTPRPTREPVAAPTEEPTAEATPVTLGNDTPSGSALQPVEIGSLSTYEHPSGVFKIDVPDNWSLQDISKPDEIQMIWTDPSRNGGVFVDIFEDDKTYTQDELSDMLSAFLKKTFDKPDLDLDDPTPQADDSVLITWSYTAKADNDIEALLLGNSFIEQRGNKVSILSMLLPQDQFDALQTQTEEIINTYKITPDAPLSTSSSGGSVGSSSSGGETVAVPASLAAIGDAVTVGNLTLTVLKVEEPAGSDFFKPDAGNKFVIVRVSFANSSSEKELVSTLLQMSLVDGAGTSYDIDLSAATLAEKTPDGEVPAGGTLEGGVGFQVPADASGLTFLFKPLLGGDPVGVALE